MRRTIAIRQFVAAALALFAVLWLVAHCAGCGLLPGDSTTDAELAYRASLLRCVDKAATLAESKACRRRVDLEYLTQDGGAR